MCSFQRETGRTTDWSLWASSGDASKVVAIASVVNPHRRQAFQRALHLLATLIWNILTIVPGDLPFRPPPYLPLYPLITPSVSSGLLPECCQQILGESKLTQSWRVFRDAIGEGRSTRLHRCQAPVLLALGSVVLLKDGY